MRPLLTSAGQSENKSSEDCGDVQAHARSGNAANYDSTSAGMIHRFPCKHKMSEHILLIGKLSAPMGTNNCHSVKPARSTCTLRALL